jgi:hypothetical protein
MGRDRFVKIEWGDNRAGVQSRDFGFCDHGFRLQTVGEAQVYARLKAEGWTVVKHGWPDFMAMKGDQVRLIEVKACCDRRRETQMVVQAGLGRAGAPVETIIIENLNRSNAGRIRHKPRSIVEEKRDRRVS